MIQDTDLDSINSYEKKPIVDVKYINLAYNICGFVAGFYLFTLSLTAITIALIYPVLGVVLCLITKGRVNIAVEKERKGAAFKSINMGFMVVVIFMLFTSFYNYTLFPSNALWIPFIIIILIFLALIYPTGTLAFVEDNKVTAVALFILTIGYAYGATRMINCGFDPSAAKVYNVQVLGKRESHGSKHDSYYLTVSPWGPMQQVNTQEVDGVLFDRVKVDDTVNVELRPGVFHVQWFILTKN